MTTRRIAGAAFLILVMLVCLPAFHSATGLHNFGGAVDAFDQGVRVPEPTTATACALAVVALLMYVAESHGSTPAACRTAHGRVSSSGNDGAILPWARSARRYRRDATSGDMPGGDGATAPIRATSAPPTPRLRANARSAEGSFVVPGQVMRAADSFGVLVTIHLNNGMERKGVRDAVQA